MDKEKLHLVDGKEQHFISLRDEDGPLFIHADGNYCDINMVQHTVIRAIRIQIGQLWSMIEEKKKMVENHLERIGRSYIINLKYVQYVNRKSGEIILHTDKDEKIKISEAAAKKTC